MIVFFFLLSLRFLSQNEREREIFRISQKKLLLCATTQPRREKRRLFRDDDFDDDFVDEEEEIRGGVGGVCIRDDEYDDDDASSNDVLFRESSRATLANVDSLATSCYQNRIFLRFI